MSCSRDAGVSCAIFIKVCRFQFGVTHSSLETYLSYTNLYVITLYFNIGARISNEMDELANVQLQLGTKG